MYFAQGHAAIQGREREGTEELGIPSSLTMQALSKQPKICFLYLFFKALLKSSIQFLGVPHQAINKKDFISCLTGVSFQGL